MPEDPAGALGAETLPQSTQHLLSDIVRSEVHLSAQLEALSKRASDVDTHSRAARCALLAHDDLVKVNASVLVRVFAVRCAHTVFSFSCS